MPDQDDVDGADSSDASFDGVHIAQAALGFLPDQVYNMDSIKALLQNFLDAVKEPQPEYSFYFDRLLSLWREKWRADRKHALLIYVLGDGEQYKNRQLDVNNLATTDKFKTTFLEQRCSRQGACLHLAKMTSAVNADADNVFELRTAISLHEIQELSGKTVVNKPVAVESGNIIQNSILQEKYHQSINRRNPYPSPMEGSPTLQTDTARSFQDWVSPLHFYFIIHCWWLDLTRHTGVGDHARKTPIQILNGQY